MKLNRVLTALTPLMLIAGAAFAATSGLPVDAPITTFVHFISTDVAHSAVGAGFAGIAAHCISGRELGFTMQHRCRRAGRRRSLQPGATCSSSPRVIAGATLGSGSFQIGDHHRLVAFVIGAVISTLIALVRHPEEQVARYTDRQGYRTLRGCGAAQETTCQGD